MATHKVRVNAHYIFYPNFLDRFDGRTGLVPGSVVKVINLHGCPPANTMGHCYVEFEGKFVGMVHCNSLYSQKDRKLVADAIEADKVKLLGRA